MDLFYSVEGDIIYPDEKKMLTWGPFYYHSEGKAKNRMEIIMQDIVSWCNLQDPSLNITPQNTITTNKQIVFKIDAWKDEKTLQKCNGIISVNLNAFED